MPIRHKASCLNMRWWDIIVGDSYKINFRIQTTVWWAYGFPTASDIVDYTKYDGHTGRMLNVLGIVKGKCSFLLSYSNNKQAFYKSLPIQNRLLFWNSKVRPGKITGEKVYSIWRIKVILSFHNFNTPCSILILIALPVDQWIRWNEFQCWTSRWQRVSSV